MTSVVQACVRASPDTAADIVLQFLLDCGMDDKQMQLFKLSWSKVYLSSQAFGQRDKPLDAALFAKELVTELSFGDKQCDYIKTLSANLITIMKSHSNDENKGHVNSKDSNTLNVVDSTAILTMLREIKTASTDLTQAFIASYSSSARDQASSSFDKVDKGVTESIMNYRRHVKVSKITTRKDIKEASTTAANVLYSSSIFLPLRICAYYGHPEAVLGSASLRLHHEQAYCSLEEKANVVSLRVSNKQATYQSKAFEALQFFYEVVTLKFYNIFPLPLGVTRDPATFTVAFSYEAPPCRALKAILGAPLATYARKHPTVPLSWAGQLIQSYLLLKSSTQLMYRFDNLPTVDDLFVRESGLLLMGNLTVLPCTLSEKERFLRTAGGDAGRLLGYGAFVHDMLAQILCLSRKVTVSLKKADDDENLDMKESVIYLMEGSAVDLCVANFQLSNIHVKSAKSKSHLKDSYDTLLIDTQGDENIVDISHHKKASLLSEEVAGVAASTTLRIDTLRSGTIMLSLQYTPPSISSPPHGTTKPSRGDDDDEEESNQHVKEPSAAAPVQVGSTGVFAYVRIVVVPAAPCSNAELAELISLLENSFVFQRPLFLDASCVRAGPDLKSEDHSNAVKAEWRSVESKLSDKGSTARR